MPSTTKKRKENKSYKVFIVAGEASGDVIGAKLLKALKDYNIDFKFKGVCGDRMKTEGMRSIFPMSDISIMGFAEVITSIPRVLKRIKQTKEAAIAFNPDIVITIDAPGFNFRLVDKLREELKDTKFIHYVAPTVWAYKPKRVFKVKKLYDHLLMLLPFEKPYFDKVGMESTFVGHHVIEDDVKPSGSKREILKKYCIAQGTKVITVMPGSRMTEINYLLDDFIGAIEKVKDKVGDIVVFIPTLKHLKPILSKKLKGKEYIITSDPEMKKDLVGISDVGLIKSGTSSVEMMKAKVPCVVAYKGNWLTAQYIKRAVKIKYASLVNLILDKPVIPEFLQHNCTAENLSKELMALITKDGKRKVQLEDFKIAMKALGQGKHPSPSQKAAKLVVNMLEKVKN